MLFEKGMVEMNTEIAPDEVVCEKCKKVVKLQDTIFSFTLTLCESCNTEDPQWKYLWILSSST